MPRFRVHLYKEFSTVVEIEADSLQEAVDNWSEGDIPDWEESGDKYVSAVTDDTGTEHMVQDGQVICNDA